MSKTSLSFSGSLMMGGCSCSDCVSSSCSCSVHASCCSHDPSTGDTTRSFGQRSAFCASRWPMSPNVVPRLLRLHATPPRSPTTTGAAEMCAPPPPPLMPPTDVWGKRATVSTQTGDGGCEETSMSLRRGLHSVGRSARHVMNNTRATSPLPSARVDAASNTELTGEQWDEERRGLLQKVALLQEQAHRCEFLETRHTSTELALASAHERMEQQCRAHAAAVAHMTAAHERHRRALEHMEPIYRQCLLAQEADTRSLLSDMHASEKCALLAAEQRRREQGLFLQASAAIAQLHHRIVSELFLDEKWHRNEVQDAEHHSRSVLRRLFHVAETCRRASSCTASALNLAEEEKRAAVAAKEVAEQQLREAFVREKELRIQYLHALRLPTTTIVSQSPQPHVSDVDDHMPVHARFVRAHKEAVEAVRAQRHCVRGYTYVV